MNKTKYIIAVCMVASALISCVSPSHKISTKDKLIQERIHGYFSPLEKQSEFSGIIRVEKNGKPVFQNFYGYSDWQNKTPFSEKTRFGVGSVTKGITAALILELTAVKAIDLDAKVSVYIPTLNDFDFTVRDVLTHKAGLPRMLPATTEVYHSPIRVSDWIINNSDNIKVNTDYSYSNVGFFLLAEIVEKAGKAPYQQLAKSKVLNKFKMNNSFIDHRAASTFDNGAIPHAPGPDPTGTMPRISEVAELGSAGLITNIEEMTRWARLIGTSQYPEFLDNKNRFGSVNKGNINGKEYIWIQGTLPGYGAGVMYWPEDDLSISYISNLFNHTLINIEPILIDLVHSTRTLQPPSRPQWETPKENHHKMAGSYNYPGFGKVIIKPDSSGSGFILSIPERGSDWDFYLTPIKEGLHFRAFNTILTKRNDEQLEAKQTLGTRKPHTFIIKKLEN